MKLEEAIECINAHGGILVPGGDHNYYPARIEFATVVYNKEYQDYFEYYNEELEDGEKLVGRVVVMT